MDAIEDRLSSLSEIIRTARGVWLVHLGIAAYAAIALSGVTDADFFLLNQKTQLPIISFAVPTKSFMLCAPLLLAVIHGYFHLQLSRIWREIGDLPLNNTGGRRWEQRTAPWIVAEMGFSWRPDAMPSPVRPISTFTVKLLGWWMPPLVAIAFVARSYAAHSVGISLLLSLIASVIIATSCMSASLGKKAVQPANDGTTARPHLDLWPGLIPAALTAVSAILIVGTTFIQTIGTPPTGTLWSDLGPYRGDLRRVEFAIRPSGWMYWRDAEIIAMAKYFAVSRSTAAENSANTGKIAMPRAASAASAV